MRDKRRAPFCWQDLGALELIQGRFAGRERVTALAVYQAMTYQASVRRDGGHEGFAATRAELAEIAGSKAATIDAYAKLFVELGILEIERRQDDGGGDLPSVWTLVTPTEGGVSIEAPRGSRIGTGGGASIGTGALTRAQQDAVEEEELRTPPNPLKGGRQRSHSSGDEADRAWVAEQLPELHGLAFDLAIAQCQTLRGGRCEITPEVVRERVAAFFKIEEPEQ